MVADKRRCERDERGWLVPRRYTMAHALYVRLTYGSTTTQAAKLLDIPLATCRVMAWRIKKPERRNEASRQRYVRGKIKRFRWRRKKLC